MVIFQNLSKNGEILKNVGENIKKIFAVIFLYTMDIKNTIFNPKFYQHFLPSLIMSKTVHTFIDRRRTPLRASIPRPSRAASRRACRSLSISAAAQSGYECSKVQVSTLREMYSTVMAIRIVFLD